MLIVVILTAEGGFYSDRRAGFERIKVVVSLLTYVICLDVFFLFAQAFFFVLWFFVLVFLLILLIEVVEPRQLV